MPNRSELDDRFAEDVNAWGDPTKFTSGGQWTDNGDVAPDLGYWQKPDDKVFAVGAFFPKNYAGAYVFDQPYDSEEIGMKYKGYPISVSCDCFVVQRTVEDLGLPTPSPPK
jgi:hypothetical protein